MAHRDMPTTIQRDALLEATDLNALATELCGPPTGHGRGARWHCPNPTHDVALLLRAAPIADITPLKVATSPPRTGASCRAVGYGVHNQSTGQITVQQRRTASEKIVTFDQTSIEVEKKTGIVDHGDSGGPLLCGKKIAGTTSCGNSNAPSHRQAWYGRVDPIADWIDQTIGGWQ